MYVCDAREIDVQMLFIILRTRYLYSVYRNRARPLFPTSLHAKLFPPPPLLLLVAAFQNISPTSIDVFFCSFSVTCLGTLWLAYQSAVAAGPERLDRRDCLTLAGAHLGQYVHGLPRHGIYSSHGSDPSTWQ